MAASTKGIRALKAGRFSIGLLAVLLMGASCPRHAPMGASGPRSAPKEDFIVYGGDIVTLDDRGTVAEALWVRDGRIAAIGAKEEVMRHKTAATELIDLHGGALLPGFVEPHLHIVDAAIMALTNDLTPCLPQRYETRADCPLTIVKALESLKEHPKPPIGDWSSGSGIDPSRMTLDGTAPSSTFHDAPARYIEQYVSATKPVFIADDSGHLAYVNRQAFVAAGICASVDNCSSKTAKKQPEAPGRWVTNPDGTYTGLIEESNGFTDFTQAMAKSATPKQEIRSLIDLIGDASATVKDIASAGVTTVVNGGAMSVSEVEILQVLAARPHPLLRYRTLLRWDVALANAQRFPKPTYWNDKDDGLFGVTGIKLWSDGSTQGCTAALVEPYDPQGQCGAAGAGKTDYSEEEIVKNLRPLWKAGWLMQVHANGDRATENVLGAFAALQAETRNDNPHTLLHFTVDGNPATGEDIVQKVADLRAGRGADGKPVPRVDVHVSHLIGHVAYWGGAFQNILDGVKGPGIADEKGRAARLDATRRDLELGVPFSLHSDTPVTPVRPLWYVEQAVTRKTWFYPKLADADAYPMPGGQNVTIDQALRAVTIEAARQHRLDAYIGSLEKGKVADLVILDKNPLKQSPDDIHKIRVLTTFIGGNRNDWVESPR
ncbi:MAG TPA: amidohydrolase family protein [Thermoanaerobaculia bacterium]|nr:amidohydrolase family protein [Thermoanaerobaculia bacterium]